MYESWSYGSNPAQEEMEIERNGDMDYLHELAVEHFDPCAGYEDYTDEELDEVLNAPEFDLDEDIPF